MTGAVPGRSPSKVEGVARRAGGVCQAATLAPMLSSHTPPSLRATIPEQSSPTRSLSPNIGEELRFPL